MITAIKSFLYDATAARRYFRGACLGLGGLLISGTVPMLAPYRDWGGALLALGGMVGVGEPNPKP